LPETEKPQCKLFLQDPSEDEVWFCNAPMGKHKLENILIEMSKKAGLVHIYTPHCIRATSATVLKATGRCRLRKLPSKERHRPCK